MKKVIRIHDNFYLNEKRHKKPKQSFIQLFKIIGNKNVVKNKSILDIGCSNGELIYNLVRKFNSNKITGYDINSKLLKLCKKKIVHENVHFKKFDISKNNKVNEKFDIIIMSGVISIFDDCEKIFNNLIRLLNKNGTIYIFNHFNSYPIDVMIKYRTHDKYSKYLQSGWNIHSLITIEKFLNKKRFKMKAFKFLPKLSFKKKIKDPLRSWTFKDKNGNNLITNGLNIIQNQYWLKIEKKSSFK